MDEDTELLRRIAATTSDIATLLRLAHGAEIASRLTRLLDSPARARAYEASDGNLSSRDVAKIAKADHTTVMTWWREWAKANVAAEGDVEGRFRALFSPKDFGVEVPK